MKDSKGGETFNFGDTITIKWRTDIRRVEAVVLYITINNGKDWCTIHDGGAIFLPNEKEQYIQMEYEWIIGKEYLPERPDYHTEENPTQCRVKVEDYTQSGLPAFFSKVFTVTCH